MGQVGPGGRTQSHGAGEAEPALVWEGAPDNGIFWLDGQAASCLLSSAAGADICDSLWDPYSQGSPPPCALCAAQYDKN